MKGYKGMNRYMWCLGMQYEVGKTYQVVGKVEMCRNGLHFCQNLKDVFKFYTKDGYNRFFEVEASGDIKTSASGNKCAAEKLTVLRELTPIEINKVRYGYGNGYGNGNSYGDVGSGGYGDGYGYGNGKGHGNGVNYGYSYGDGDGYGCGDGYGYGYAHSDGYGYGTCEGYRLTKILMFID